jgi:hypothetical protein
LMWNYHDGRSGQICPWLETNYSRQSYSGVYLRRDKLCKVDFRYEFERVGRAQIYYDGVIIELKRQNSQRSVAGAVYAAVAAVIILLVFKRGAGGIVRSRSINCSACSSDRDLHGVSTFMGTLDRNGQHDKQKD